MMKMNRIPTPNWLKSNYKKWGISWKNRLINNSKVQFHWHSHEDNFKKELGILTQFHCAFCDAFPLVSKIRFTIEHFRPKRKYPYLSFCWENLFPCCDNCQAKNDQFDKKLLLKPDKVSYEFDKYFCINWTNGEIEPVSQKNTLEFKQAEYTIKLYRLNEYGRPQARLDEVIAYEKTNDPKLDQFSYRFFIERK